MSGAILRPPCCASRARFIASPGSPRSYVKACPRAQFELGRKRGAPKPTLPDSWLIFDVLHEALGAGVFELSLRGVPAPIFVNLGEVDDERRGG